MDSFEGIVDNVSGIMWGLDGRIMFMHPIHAIELAVVNQRAQATSKEVAKEVRALPGEQAEIREKAAAARRSDPAVARTTPSGAGRKVEPFRLASYRRSRR